MINLWTGIHSLLSSTQSLRVSVFPDDDDDDAFAGSLAVAAAVISVCVYLCLYVYAVGKKRCAVLFLSFSGYRVFRSIFRSFFRLKTISCSSHSVKRSHGKHLKQRCSTERLVLRQKERTARMRNNPDFRTAFNRWLESFFLVTLSIKTLPDGKISAFDLWWLLHGSVAPIDCDVKMMKKNYKSSTRKISGEQRNSFHRLSPNKKGRIRDFIHLAIRLGCAATWIQTGIFGILWNYSVITDREPVAERVGIKMQ